jgi:hypothetical protein
MDERQVAMIGSWSTEELRVSSLGQGAKGLNTRPISTSGVVDDTSTFWQKAVPSDSEQNSCLHF